MAAVLAFGVAASLTACAPAPHTEGTAGQIKKFTGFFTVSMPEIDNNNEIQQRLSELTGAECKETWLTGQTTAEAIGTLVAGGVYPDFISAGEGCQRLYEEGVLIPLDEYWDDYPNIKNFWTPQQWDRVRRDDGHVYWIPQFGQVNGKEMGTVPDEAFWVQTRVLKWAGYPRLETMDEYFQLLEAYQAANPAMADGTPNIPYTILCEGERYFCLENAPQFLDGYPNDGSVIVDPDEEKVIDYNTTATAKRYFAKLNEEFQKGIVDPEFFSQTYDEYIAKLCSGRVLGMIDQYWDFGYAVGDVFKQTGLDAEGCDYIPFGLTIEAGIKNQWKSYTAINGASGLAITTDCKDIAGALHFVDALLSPQAATLRSWGEEGVDYLVDDKGVFYRTDTMRAQAVDPAYKAKHLCAYPYFPNYGGMNPDGVNAAAVDNQPGEFYDSLSEDVQEAFTAYGVKTYNELLGVNEIPGPWFPLYSFSGTLTTATPGGTAWTRMGEVKHEWLPKVVMTPDFEAAWGDYMAAYQGCKPEDFLAEMQAELERCIAEAAKYQK